ncbi:MAG TPA: DUF1993 domain-containing protein [Xanthomonadales bacterium]|nr:DUF1993 domain-containing protein [Xanthomonadales bacterium]
MTGLVYELCIAPMLQSLGNLDAIVGKAETHVRKDEHLEPATLIQGRLFPNMRPFVFQIQVATDTAKGAAARLAGTEIPVWPDDEETFNEVHQRIVKAIEYLSGFAPKDFEGADQRSIKLKLGSHEFQFTGAQYIQRFVLPNFYFHMVTAYNILRQGGVDVGKRDFLAGL